MRTGLLRRCAPKKKQTDKLLILFNVMDEPPPSVLFHPRGSAKGRCGTRNDGEDERRHETTLARHCERSEANHLAAPSIASEAKQSISPRKERMDCFAALAKTTKRTFAASPRDAPDDRPREAIHRPGRLCEPPGRANARPMTGSAKQSI